MKDPLNTVVRMKEARKQLTRLNKEIMELERRILGRAKIGFESTFSFDSRYKWNNDIDDLTPKMRAFVEEYPKDLNATQASVRAGYAEGSAATRGNWLLKQRKVVMALRKEVKRMTKRNRVEQDTVLKEISQIAYSNIADFISWNEGGITLKASNLLSRMDTACIKEVSETQTPKTTTVKFKLYDKPQALLVLCRFLGILDREDGKEDAKEIATKIRGYLGNIDDSMPGPPEELPDNVVRFDKRLSKFENRLDGT